jgi:hypothetical protein
VAGSSKTPTVLLVCNSSEQGELRRHFDEALPGGQVEIVFGDGGDDTLALFTRTHPAVVVACATLDRGDTRALLEAMRTAIPGFRSVLIGDERGPVRNALDAADFGVDRFVPRPVVPKALRFAVSSSLDVARVTRPGRASSSPDVPRAAPDVPTVVAPVASPSSATQPAAHPMLVAPAPTMPGTGGTIPPATRRLGTDDSGRFTRPPDPPPAAPEAVRTELRQRWTALADAISDHGIELPADLLEDDVDDEPAPPVPPIAVPTPPPVVIRPRRTEPSIVAAPPPIEAAPAAPAPVSPSSAITRPVTQPADGSGPIVAPTSPPTPPPTPGERAVMEAFRRSAIMAAVQAPPDDVPEAPAAADSIPGIEPFVARDLVEPPAQAPSVPTANADQATMPAVPPADEPAPAPAPVSPPEPERLPRAPTPPPVWTPREPTLILSEPARPAAPAAVSSTAPTAAAPADPPAPVAPVRTRSKIEPARGELRDAELAEKGPIDDADIPDYADDPTPLPAPAPVMTEPGDEPPARPSEPSLPSGTDFARELRKKMSAMAQRLFKSADAAPAPAVDLGLRHDHKTEIDLVALVDPPAAGGVTEIEAKDEPAPPRDDVPNTSDTQVRIGAESGDIIRGVSDAAAILSRAFAQAFTGRAVLRRPADPPPGDAVIEKQIFFDRGRPVFAASNQAYDRMGQLLVREGKITPDQFSRCQTIVAASGRRMGEILVDLGYLKRRELLPAVRRHVEDIIYSLFAWSSGQFQMIAGDGAASERIRLSRHPAGMILEGVRRKLGTTELERLIGPTTTVVEIGDKDKLTALIGTADLSAEERAAVGALDGANDLATVARVSRIDVANALQLAWGLIVLGVAHARRRDSDLDVDEQGVLVGETDLAIDRERVRARWHLVSDADYFALLGVRRDASSFEIKRAYEAARRDFAPDVFPAELRRELARELDDIAQVLDEAYHVLRDDRLRGAYLHHLRD